MFGNALFLMEERGYIYNSKQHCSIITDLFSCNQDQASRIGECIAKIMETLRK